MTVSRLPLTLTPQTNRTKPNSRGFSKRGLLGTAIRHLSVLAGFMVGNDPRLSGVDERSQSGTSFPEAGTSFEGMVMHRAADILR